MVVRGRRRIGKSRLIEGLGKQFQVLIHINGVSDEVFESQYFANIVDFSQLLQNAE